jgi:hypothetical protein
VNGRPLGDEGVLAKMVWSTVFPGESDALYMTR